MEVIPFDHEREGVDARLPRWWVSPPERRARDGARIYFRRMASPDDFPALVLPVRPPHAPMEAQAVAELGRAGLDGVGAKRADAAYAPGARTAMHKVKRARTVDCVVGGFRLPRAGDHVGFASIFSVLERRPLEPIVEPLVRAPGLTGSAPGGPGRWSAGRSMEWQPLEPRLVCEVRYDHFSGRRVRHGAKLLRWRPDKDPRLCTFARVEGRPDRGLEQFWSRRLPG